MLRIITRNHRYLLTGVLMQQLDSENVKVKSEKSVWDQLKESADIERIKILVLGKNVQLREESEHRANVKELDAKTNGWDRVKMAFHIDENKKSVELYFISHMAISGWIGGFTYGGMREYVKASNLFLYSNDASKFLGVKDAKRALARVAFEAFLKGGLFTAPKVAILCGIFGASYTALTAYSGKNGISQFALAGAVTTAVMKWNLGIRGMISGFVSGGLTGLTLGTIMTVIMSSTGKSILDLQKIIYELHSYQENIRSENEKSTTRSDFEKFYSERTDSLPVGFSDN